MNLDLKARSSLAFIFGFVGLMVCLIGTLAGLPTSPELIGGFVAIICATLGIEAIRGGNDDGPRSGDRAAPVVEGEASGGEPEK